MVSKIKTPEFNELLKSLSERGAIKYVPPKNFIPVIQKALSPQETGFQLMTMSEFINNRPQNKEVWIGGPVIALRKDMYDLFLSTANAE